MKHFAGPSFRECFDKLTAHLQELADKNFVLLKGNPQHPSLHIKRQAGTGQFGSA
jgi:hypothetical protein